MKKFIHVVPLLIFVFATLLFMTPHSAMAQGAGCGAYNTLPACASIDTGDLGFQIPSLGDILTFAIRAFFVIAGLAALFYLLLGALGWVTSGGDKDAVTAARDKIQAAVIGMILIVGVLAIIWTLEQVIFKRRICLGLSCPLTLPGLIETSTGATNCCACLADDGRYCAVLPVLGTLGTPQLGCTREVADTFANEECGK